MTKTYYHATEHTNLSSILSDGIKKGMDGYVYLTDDPKDAVKFLAIRFCKDIVVFEVELDEEEVSESYDHNERFFQCKAYIYPKDIRSDQIMEVYNYKIGY